MMDRAPISSLGWRMVLHYYDGRTSKPFLTSDPKKGYSLSHCKRMRAIWHDDKHDGLSEVVIMPVDGWESIKADPFGAIAWAIAEGLVSIQVGQGLIQAIADEVVGRLPSESLLGLAIHYLRADELGSDDEITQVVETLRENLHRRVGDVDAAMPF